MTLLLIIAAVGFTLVAAYHLVKPFLFSRFEQLRFEVLDEDLRRVEELAAQKSTLLQTLRDVEFDYETEKISEEDYHELKTRYEREAVQVMRKLDEIHGGRGWEEAIDAELARRLEKARTDKAGEQRRDTAVPAASDDAAVEMIVCPGCSKEMEADARFCSQCGTTLADDDPAASSNASGADETVSTAHGSETVRQDSPALSQPGSEVAT